MPIVHNPSQPWADVVIMLGGEILRDRPNLAEKDVEAAVDNHDPHLDPLSTEAEALKMPRAELRQHLVAFVTKQVQERAASGG